MHEYVHARRRTRMRVRTCTRLIGRPLGDVPLVPLLEDFPQLQRGPDAENRSEREIRRGGEKREERESRYQNTGGCAMLMRDNPEQRKKGGGRKKKAIQDVVQQERKSKKSLAARRRGIFGGEGLRCGELR